LKLYDREKWLLKKRTEYPVDFIRNNQFKKRIEFVLQYGKSSYLNLHNLDGTYFETIERFIFELAKLYKRYFFNRIFVNPIEHECSNSKYHPSGSSPQTKRIKTSPFSCRNRQKMYFSAV
jgi:hypothetical protein